MPADEKKFKIWEEDGIIVGKLWGVQEEEDAFRFAEEMLKIMETTREKAKILFDTSEVEHGSSLRARKALLGLTRKAKFEKAAIYGLGTLIKVVATFIIRAAGKENVKFFSTEEEALKWLKEV